MKKTKKTKKTKRMTCRQALVRLARAFENMSPDESYKLWNVISAMRGPDESGRRSDKASSTAIIRYRVFGNGCIGRYADTKREDTRTEEKTRRSMSPGHFYDHARIAFEALGLNWNEQPNGKIRPLWRKKK